jgi:hypothetical protein
MTDVSGSQKRIRSTGMIGGDISTADEARQSPTHEQSTVQGMRPPRLNAGSQYVLKYRLPSASQTLFKRMGVVQVGEFAQTQGLDVRMLA